MAVLKLEMGFDGRRVIPRKMVEWQNRNNDRGNRVIGSVNGVMPDVKSRCGLHCNQSAMDTGVRCLRDFVLASQSLHS